MHINTTAESFADFERKSICSVGKKKNAQLRQNIRFLLPMTVNHSFCQISIHTKYL